MKKIVLVFFTLLFIFSIYNIFKQPEEKQEIKGVFISYIDYSNLKGRTKKEQEDIIAQMIENVEDFGLNTVILQVRPFMDAIYNSNIFLSSQTVVNKEGDPLKIDILKEVLNKAHEKGIKVHAWVNPYRIRNTVDKETLNKKSPYYKWLNTTNIEINETGIYLNPASQEVLNLILEGILELVKNYDIDGIVYDDYFYPSNTIDLDNYDKYIQNNPKIPIEKYRINNINKLIKETYNIIKKEKKEVIFSISPAGNIENNLNKEYLDIEEILSKEGYIDYVMPQLYYGFLNQTKPYIKTMNDWNKRIKNNTKLIPALALYKSGKEDKYAGTGKEEWKTSNDIIKKQILVSRGMSNYNGFVIYRYNNLFNKSPNANMKKEITNLKELLKENNEFTKK